MISIKQNTSFNKTGLEKVLETLGSTVLVLDTQSIDDDIQKLRKRIQDGKASRMDMININKIVKYLEKLKTKVLPSNNSVRIAWGIQDNTVVSSNASIKQFKRYGIQAIDYIIPTEGNYIVTVNYSELLDAIALEMVHRDIGMETTDIEEALKEINIFGINDIQILKELEIFEDGLFEDAKGMKVEDSIYNGEKGLISYFGWNVGKEETYKKAMEDTARIATNIILKEVLDRVAVNIRAHHDGLKQFKLIGVYEDGFSFMVDDMSVLGDVIESVAIRIFGRTFEIKTKINKYVKEA